MDTMNITAKSVIQELYPDLNAKIIGMGNLVNELYRQDLHPSERKYINATIDELIKIISDETEKYYKRSM